MFFLYISNIQSIKWKKQISVLANLIIVIYIIHPIVIRFYYEFVNMVGLGYLYTNLIRLSVVYIISTLLSWVLLKIPYAKEIFKI